MNLLAPAVKALFILVLGSLGGGAVSEAQDGLSTPQQTVPNVTSGDLAADVATIGTTETVLTIDKVVRVSSNLTVPSTLGLRVERQGQIRIEAGTTLRVSGPLFIESSKRDVFTGHGALEVDGTLTAPPRELFGRNLTVNMDDYSGMLIANWWPGTDFGEQWNNAKGSVTDWSDHKGPHGMKGLGHHEYKTPLDATGMRPGPGINHRVLDFREATLFCKVSGGVCVDLTHSRRLDIYSLQIYGSTTAAESPDVGVLLARDAEAEKSAGGHTFYSLHVSGRFNSAALYNVGSEENAWFFPQITSTHGRAVYLGNTNPDNVSSPHTGAIAPSSRTIVTNVGAMYRADIRGGTANEKGVIHINGATSFTLDRPFVRHDSPIPHFFVEGSVGGLIMRGVTAEHGDATNRPAHIFVYKGGTGQQLANATLHFDNAGTSTDEAVHLERGSLKNVLLDLRFETNGFLAAPGTAIENSIIWARASSVNAPVTLGKSFSGVIYMGDVPTQLHEADTMEGVVFDMQPGAAQAMYQYGAGTF